MQPEKVDAGWAKRPGSVQTPASPVRSSAESGPRQRTPKKNERKTNPVVVKNEEECNPSLRLGIGCYLITRYSRISLSNTN